MNDLISENSASERAQQAFWADTLADSCAPDPSSADSDGFN